MQARGINLAERVCTIAEYIEIRPKLMELIFANNMEWGFYCDATDVCKLARENHLYCAPSIDKPEAMIVFDVEEYLTGNVEINVIWSSGESIIPHVEGFVLAAEELARKYGARRIKMRGRKAFEHLLSPYGFQFDHVSLTKEL
jgi:hypothetical protein